MNTYKKGFSLIEIFVGLAVVGLLILIVVPGFAGLRENQTMKNAVVDILSSINKARSKTLASVDSSEYGVYFASDRVIIFKGTVYSAQSADNEIVNIVSPASIANVTLNSVSGSTGEIYFSKLSGAPSKTGTLTISSSFSKTITISPSGGASVN